MRYKSRQPHSERPLSCEELEAKRCLSAVSFSPRQIISDEVDGPQSVFAADLDGDGDVDVLSASNGDNKIAWYENTDGKGNFGPQIVISSRVGSARSVIAADVDGDRDLDVLMSSFSAIRRLTDNEVVISNSIIAWYENMDGKGAFSEENVITRRAGASAVHAADVDGDGDVDILTNSYFAGTIAWYENDGKGSFGQQKTISSTVDGASGVNTADIDGDGDVDVLAASPGALLEVDGRLVRMGDQKIGWFENTDGKGTFGDENVIAREVIAYSTQAADVDGDGDLDVLSAGAWYENTDGMGDFGPPQVISTEVDIYPADLDGDGDFDLFGAGRDIIVWFENIDGMGDFGPENVLDEGREIHQVSEVRAADVDGDGDMDVLSASGAGDHIAWYENLRITAGDANRDGLFDQLDIVQVLQAAKYLSGEPATFEEGDWNGDGVFDQLDIVEALQTGNYLQVPEAAHRDN